jgi:type II secretory pathway pseudopilin PulG
MNSNYRSGFGLVGVLVALLIFGVVAGAAAYYVSSMMSGRKKHQEATVRDTTQSVAQMAGASGIDASVTRVYGSDGSEGEFGALPSGETVTVWSGSAHGRTGVEGFSLDFGSGVTRGYSGGLRVVGSSGTLSAAVEVPCLNLEGFGFAGGVGTTLDEVVGGTYTYNEHNALVSATSFWMFGASAFDAQVVGGFVTPADFMDSWREAPIAMKGAFVIGTGTLVRPRGPAVPDSPYFVHGMAAGWCPKHEREEYGPIVSHPMLLEVVVSGSTDAYTSVKSHVLSVSEASGASGVWSDTLSVVKYVPESAYVAYPGSTAPLVVSASYVTSKASNVVSPVVPVSSGAVADVVVTSAYFFAPGPENIDGAPGSGNIGGLVWWAESGGGSVTVSVIPSGVDVLSPYATGLRSVSKLLVVLPGAEQLETPDIQVDGDEMGAYVVPVSGTHDFPLGSVTLLGLEYQEVRFDEVGGWVGITESASMQFSGTVQGDAKYMVSGAYVTSATTVVSGSYVTIPIANPDYY